MEHSDFSIGATFWCGEGQWRCTDIGTRTIIAMRIDKVEIHSNDPALCRTLGYAEALADGCFNGPPYALPEHVFDEYDLPGCSAEPDMP